LALRAKLSTGCCCPSFSVVGVLNIVVAGISWIRIMCWNFRERRPHPTYHLASVANVSACLSKCMQNRQYASISLLFIPFVQNIPWTQNILLQIVCIFVFGTATFWRVNYFTNLAPKNLKYKAICDFMYPFRRAY
jgi:hypothetical protein